MAKKSKKTTAKNAVKAGKLPKSKGRFYEDPDLVRSERDPNFKKLMKTVRSGRNREAGGPA